MLKECIDEDMLEGEMSHRTEKVRCWDPMKNKARCVSHRGQVYQSHPVYSVEGENRNVMVLPLYGTEEFYEKISGEFLSLEFVLVDHDDSWVLGVLIDDQIPVIFDKNLSAELCRSVLKHHSVLATICFDSDAVSGCNMYGNYHLEYIQESVDIETSQWLGVSEHIIENQG